MDGKGRTTNEYKNEEEEEEVGGVNDERRKRRCMEREMRSGVGRKMRGEEEREEYNKEEGIGGQ